MDACMYGGVDIVKINGLMAVKGDSKSLKKFPRSINVFKQSPRGTEKIKGAVFTF